jgi:hypothetical protein
MTPHCIPAHSREPLAGLHIDVWKAHVKARELLKGFQSTVCFCTDPGCVCAVRISVCACLTAKHV